jgi:putative thioredoxin
MAPGEWTEAMDELLEIIMRDKKWADEAPRKTYIGSLELMTPAQAQGRWRPRPARAPGASSWPARPSVAQDPQAEMVSRYRRKLSMALN